ncbi:hypothetical protein BST81_12045 [Leptolyngbya sp. 'hensonii']|uniref:hypothetical protein n=1 Tax=Leptolyngbya sp. 'hensonii' TaxID=1922337 RepID=UPI0009500EF9|nr:hypothetical protein [Leptolyngbya sp. 'hensonii']OLP17795.1 hypothetical protein BST81_12045 [Leptolyngbya sp. 'hensonii']
MNLPIALSGLAVLALAFSTAPASAQIPFIEVNKLNTLDGLAWGAPSWIYNATANIEAFGGGVVGRVVLDRGGIQVRAADIYKVIFNDPFTISPGKIVVVTSWTSRNEGCSMDMVVQIAPYESMSREQAESYLVPRQVDIAVGYQRIVTLKPQTKEGEEKYGKPFRGTYSYYDPTKNKNYNLYWYMGRNIYRISAEDAAKLVSAQPGIAKAQIWFRAETSPYQFEIGEGTVNRWKEVFSYNPSCKPGGAGKPGSVATTPNPGTASVPAPQQPADAPTQPTQATQPVEPLKPVFKGPVSEYPTNDQFNAFKSQYLASANSGTGVKLTPSEKKVRQAFQNAWAKTNKFTARFLGAWYSRDRLYYVYPSKVKARTCVITQTGETLKFQIGTTLAPGREMQFAEGSFFWVDKENIVAGRDKGTAELYPVYATQASPQLTPNLIENLEKWECEKTLPGGPSMADLPQIQALQ